MSAVRKEAGKRQKACVWNQNIHFCKMLLIIKTEPVMTTMQWHSLCNHALLTLIRVLKFFTNGEEKSSSHDRNRDNFFPMGRI